MDQPTRDLIEEIKELIIKKYPGLDVEEVVAALEVVKVNLVIGSIHE